jgi:uncharacterized membrane protein YfcA
LRPVDLFIFGADIHTAGSAALFVSIPTLWIGLVRYRRIGLLPNRATLIRVGLPMGVESLIGAAAAGIFAGSTSAEVLKLLLGAILIAAAVKAFWRRFLVAEMGELDLAIRRGRGAGAAPGRRQAPSDRGRPRLLRQGARRRLTEFGVPPPAHG